MTEISTYTTYYVASSLHNPESLRMSVTDTANDRSKKYKSPGTVQTAAEMIQAGRETHYIQRSITLLTLIVLMWRIG